WVFHAGLGSPAELRVTWGVRGLPEYSTQAPYGYLLPGIRTILFAQYLMAVDDGSDRTVVNLCHETARRLLMGFEATRSHPSNASPQPALVGALGQYLPAGLRARMKDAALDPADDLTFVCEPESSETERGRERPP